MKQLLCIYRYNRANGNFTVPSGGDGYYYFMTYITIKFDEYGYHDIEINGRRKCTAYHRSDGLARGQGVCSVFAYVTAGV